MIDRISPLTIKIICGGLILAIAVGIRQSFGLFLDPVSTTLQIGRETFALSIGLINLLWGALAPFTGALSDKFGLKKVAIFGTLLYSLGIYILSNSSHGYELIIGGLIVGAGLSGLGFTVILGGGFAHSVECWDEEGLQGGLYGVRIDRVFFGESMFSRKTDASKIALVRLVEWLRDEGVILLDTQWMTDHLKTFGGYEVPADIYRGMLAEAIDVKE